MNTTARDSAGDTRATPAASTGAPRGVCQVDLMGMVPGPAVPSASNKDLGGLLVLVAGEPRALPLALIRVRAKIAGDCCCTVVEQRFRNDHEEPLEATYIFPLPPGGALTEMELVAGDRTVRAECRRRREAEQVFAEAREGGHRAALLSEDSGNVFTMQVTNLPPATDVTVRLVIHERLEHADGRHLWRFPTVIAPRYLPGEPIGHEGSGVLPDTDAVPDASRLQPPLRLEGGTMLDLEVSIAGPLSSVASSLHAVRVDLGRGEAGDVRVAPSVGATLDRDFVLAFTSAEQSQAAARAWTDGTHTLVVVEPPALEPASSLPRDAVFVIDISGSMAGTKMTAARQAVSGALHGLDRGDRFTIIAFDDRLLPFSERLVEYSDDSLALADAWIDRLEARGGTEMLPAVAAALAGTTPQGRLRTVLLITDGQVWNDAQLVATVAAHDGPTRFFTMGIDTSVNSGLLQRLARVGGGTCELLTPNDDIEAAVTNLEARFGSPLLDDLRVEGAESASDGTYTLFAGQPVSILCAGAPHEVNVVGSAGAASWSQRLQPLRTETALGALWARERVAVLEDRLAAGRYDEAEVRDRIEDVALTAGIVSRFTSFVAVDTTVTVTGERVEVLQPIELPHLWDERFRQGPPDMLLSSGRGIAGRAALHEAAFFAANRVDASRFAPASDATLSIANAQWSRHASAPVAADVGPSVGDIGTDSAGPVRDERSKLGSAIARKQRADGGFEGGVGETAAALAALVLMGHTCRRGIRRRTVSKAARWLREHGDEPEARVALALLDRAEKGDSLDELKRTYWPQLSVLPAFQAWADTVWPEHD